MEKGREFLRRRIDRLERQAQRQRRLGLPHEALKSLQQAFGIACREPSADGLLLATTGMNLAGAHYYLEYYEASETLYREALTALEALAEPAPRELLYCLCNLAELRELNGDREAALELARRAHEVVQQTIDADPYHLAEGLIRIADFYGSIEEFHRALQLVHESALLMEEGGGEELLLCLGRLARLSADGSDHRSELRLDSEEPNGDSDS